MNDVEARIDGDLLGGDTKRLTVSIGSRRARMRTLVGGLRIRAINGAP